jgi:hypothetical protein
MKHLGVIRSKLRVHILSWVTAIATSIRRAVVHPRLSRKWPQQVALVASTAVLRTSPCRPVVVMFAHFPSPDNHNQNNRQQKDQQSPTYQHDHPRFLQIKTFNLITAY